MWMCPRCEGLYEVNHQPHECEPVSVAESDGDIELPPTFETELSALINRHSMENASNTPDFILAAYMSDCLATWNRWVKRRDGWYGVKLRPGMSGNGPDQDPVEVASSGPKTDHPRVPYLREATPQLVREALKARGWQLTDDTELWSVWQAPSTRVVPQRVMVPQRTDYDDYPLRMAEALKAIRLAHGEPEDERDAELLALRGPLS